ncbi:Nuclear transcription factor Y subunit B [Zostera marina]|uniref:Nuclear transcription factor Y subunit B n=1 Tax=Zostera marina TaxID=29655 RepID=A0A0K9PM43_ZOSMR|nr:Nuclear transcription factor Y subunit B [Zostera marina]
MSNWESGMSQTGEQMTGKSEILLPIREDEKGERAQDGYLPIANISRIMRKAVPGNVKISKNSKDFVQECVSEFISFITSEASFKCKTEGRRTITGDDVLSSMESLGFEDYVKSLKSYLESYRKMEAMGSSSASTSLTTNNDNQVVMTSAYANSYGTGNLNMNNNEEDPFLTRSDNLCNTIRHEHD